MDRLEEIAGCRALRISATAGTGLKELRTALDALAARLVPETRANRPAATAVKTEDDEGWAAI